MRTTVILPDELYRRVKQRSQAEGRTMTSFFEAALQHELNRLDAGRREVHLAEPFEGRGGTLPGVDLADGAALLELMDSDAPLEGRR